jgi:tetratricopeptide (TPR) repeat protein
LPSPVARRLPMTTDSLQAGLQLHRSGQLDRAEPLYRQVLAAEPRNSDALHYLGVLLIQRGQSPQGSELIRQAISLRPDAVDYHVSLTEYFIQSGLWKEVDESIRRIVASEPTNHALLMQLGRRLAQFGRRMEAIELIKLAISAEPQNAEYRGMLAILYCDIGRNDLAIEELREGIRRRPLDARLWHNLGAFLCNSNQIGEGLKAIDEALRLNPELAGALANRAVALRQLGRRAEAMLDLRRGIEIDPRTPQLQNNLGALLYDDGKWEESMAAWKLAVEQAPNSPMEHWNYARVLLQLGYFEQGWDEFEWRLKLPLLKLNRNFKQPQWDGSDPTGKTILLYAEGGHGDAIQFIRLAPEIIARGGKWLLECQPALVSLFENLPGIDRVIPRGEELPEFDMQIPLQSLPRIARVRLENIPSQVPYLKAPQDRVRRWADRLVVDPHPRVGLVWAGSTVGGDVRTRSLSTFAPLAGAGNIRFYSLQKGDESRQPPPPGMDWVDYTTELHDFVDTAALVQNLDLVITVDTSMAHLAGALARPVWVLIPFQSDFRWLIDRTDSPWYPTMRLFREPTNHDIATPIAQMVEALREFRT